MARFAIERQILASLNHPGIARLVDGGVTDEGLPFIALEFIEGLPLSVYCDKHRLTVTERLRLFVSICKTVDYAHQNLVLHRDLKPSNILVTKRGEVKLLDFGIAKLLNPELSNLPSPVTRAEQRILTPEYASPEQVRGEPLSTACDVYSLGILLYELLAGVRPYTLTGKTTQEVIHIVSEEEPAPPSVAATDPTGGSRSVAPEAPADAASIAYRRQLGPERLRRRLAGDLDAITMRALRKEPNRRYGSAELFAQDIERHLDQEPVVARRGNRRYRFGKFLRRRRVEVIAAAIVVGSLLMGLGAALWQTVEARKEHDRALVARAQAEEVASFLENLFTASDPYAPVPERLDTLRVRAFLGRSVSKLRTQLENQPVVQARMLDVVGRVYRNLALYGEARELLENALAIRRRVFTEPSSEVAETLVNLGVLALETGEYETAQGLLEEALEINTAALGERHPVIAGNLNHLATVLRERGEYDRAQETHLEAIAMLQETSGDRDARLGVFMNDLVATLEQEGNHQLAREYGYESVSLQRRLYGDNHPQLAIAKRELGLVLQRLGNYAEAEKLFRDSMEILVSALGPEHPQVADLLNRLASVRWWQKDYAAADSIHRKSLALKRKIYGDVHLEVAYGLNNLASVLRDKGEYDEAVDMHRESIGITRTVLGTEHSNYWIVSGNLGKTLWYKGECEEGEPLLQASLQGIRRTIPHDPLRPPLHAYWLGGCLVQLGRYSEAEKLLLDSHAALVENRGENDPFAVEVAGELEKLYAAWDKPEKVEDFRSARISRSSLR